jgi:glycosyltransferase involved in cell wall biosynthesis
MLSIIIPTLNEEKYINKLLSSLKNQFYKNFEVIIVDGNSTDSTAQVVDKFKHRFKRLDFITAKEANPSAQRNIGAKVAVGEVLLFLDADIILQDQHFLTEVVKLLKAYPGKGAFTVRVKTDPRESSWKDKFYLSLANIHRKICCLSRCYPLVRGCFVVKKNCFEKVRGFRTDLRYVSHLDLCRRLKKVTKIMNTPLVAYESSRRYHLDGYLKVMFVWKLNWLWYLLFRKEILKTLKPVR